MKLLIAIVTSHAEKYRERANSQRETWIPDAIEEGFDVRFFLGMPPGEQVPGDDEVFLPVGDGYRALPDKTRAMCQWAAEREYDYVFKTDDDVYITPCNLKRRVPESGMDYVGTFRGPSGGYLSDYASGYAYWLSRRAIDVLAKSELNGDWAEDRWVANTLAHHGGFIGWNDQHSYRACYPPVLPELLMRGSLKHCSAVCEYPPKLMKELFRIGKGYQVLNPNPAQITRTKLVAGRLPEIPHDDMDHIKQTTSRNEIIIPRSAKRPLDKCSVLIKTFLRDGYLFDTVQILRREYPDLRILVVDDGYPAPNKHNLFKEIRGMGGEAMLLPFDSGFGAKANAMIPFMQDRPFVLIGSDDFNFSGDVVRHGIEKMLTVLEYDQSIGVASGRVDNNPYEGFLSYGPDFIRETRLACTDYLKAGDVEYKLCDLTVNYSLIRSSMLGFIPVEETTPRPAMGAVHWEAIYKIGGEHHDFFQDVKNAGWKTAWLPGVNIPTYRHDPSKGHPDYDRYRSRAINCVGKFVRKHTGQQELPEHFYYIDFDGNKSDYAAIARQRGL